MPRPSEGEQNGSQPGQEAKESHRPEDTKHRERVQHSIVRMREESWHCGGNDHRIEAIHLDVRRIEEEEDRVVGEELQTQVHDETDNATIESEKDCCSQDSQR